jgi:hypothetical protein
VLSFDLTFVGVIDPKSSHVSSFLVSAYDEDDEYLGRYDPKQGSLATITWVLPRTAGVEGTIGVKIFDPAVTVVPEPAGSLLMGAGLALMALMFRRRLRAGRGA